MKEIIKDPLVWFYAIVCIALAAIGVYAIVVG